MPAWCSRAWWWWLAAWWLAAWWLAAWWLAVRWLAVRWLREWSAFGISRLSRHGGPRTLPRLGRSVCAVTWWCRRPPPADPTTPFQLQRCLGRRRGPGPRERRQPARS